MVKTRMMHELSIRKIGNSLGVILTREALSQLHVNEGDKLFLVKAPDGSMHITPYDPEFENQMKIAQKAMSKYRNALHTLAK